MRIKFIFLLIFQYFISTSIAFYGDPLNQTTLPSIYDAATVTMGNKIYMIGGQVVDEFANAVNSTDVTIVQFSAVSNDLQVNTITPKNPFISCTPCQGYVLPDNDTIVVTNVFVYPTYIDKATNTTVYPNVLGFYHISNNTFTYGANPRNSTTLSRIRRNHSSAMSVNNDAIFVLGGDTEISASPRILKYDIRNTSSITQLNATGDILYIGGSCSVMLPNGLIVMAFGNSYEFGLYDSNFVHLFNTNTNQLSNQSIATMGGQSYPDQRMSAACALGPDKSTIYYFGGQRFNNNNIDNVYLQHYYNDILMLDTKTWTWVQPTMSGKASLPAARASMTLFGQEQNELVITPGTQGAFVTSFLSVVKNVPQQLGDSLAPSNMQWFTNYPAYDNAESGKGQLSDGAIAGIVIAVIIILMLATFLIWRYVPGTKRVLTYIQQDIIWNPRSGEPLWAETARLLVRFILLFLFLAFVVYVIYRSVNSPVVIQQIVTPSDSVLAPDVRFCFDGFNMSAVDTSANPFMTCMFRNGTNCSDKIVPLDSSIYTPFFSDRFGNVSCFLFLPGSAFYIVNDGLGFTDSTGTKLLFSFFGQNTTADISRGVIYIDFYPPDYDPNTVVYGLVNRTQSKLTDLEINQWTISEQAFNLVDTIILKQSVVTTASYTLTTEKTLRRQDGWNYIGFSSTYDETTSITGSFKDSPQNVALMPSNHLVDPVSQLTIQPSDFTINTNVDQKVFTLLNAFAQAGGVLGLFIALQTILFGFRPQSPWGIVHRWSFGKLRVKLTDMLAHYFDRMGTPVPLVNPVNNRLSTVNGHAFNNNNTYIPYGPDVPSAADDHLEEDNANQESRVQRVEERLQLMELLLKSYYLNDEVFRSLDQAVKRGNEEKRRSGLLNMNDKETDSALRNNALNEEFELSTAGCDNSVSSAPTADVKRRPSSTVFQPRDVYQPRLAPEDPLELYDDDDEHKEIKKN